jgi:hypothetical protein
LSLSSQFNILDLIRDPPTFPAGTEVVSLFPLRREEDRANYRVDDFLQDLQEDDMENIMNPGMVVAASTAAGMSNVVDEYLR